MFIDKSLQVGLDKAPATAAYAESAGYDAVWTTETIHDPFLVSGFASLETTTISIGTCVAIAFARSPMTTAYSAWDLHAATNGRFLLGLGTQIKPHIERRFSMPWSQPANRMREYVEALRAIWASWQTGAPLNFQGDFYSHTLMTPLFSPPPSEHGVPKVFVAGLGEVMAKIAGQVGDGLLVHPMGSPRYWQEKLIPAVTEGLAACGKTRKDFQIVCMPLIVTGQTEELMRKSKENIRGRLAFYASTPAYRVALDLHGWSDLQSDLRDMSKRGEWEHMGSLIDDEMLDTLAIVAEPDQLQAKVEERFGALADRIILEGDPTLDHDEFAQFISSAKARPVR